MVNTYWLLGRKVRRPKRARPLQDAQSSPGRTSPSDHALTPEDATGDVTPSGHSEHQSISQSEESKSEVEESENVEVTEMPRSPSRSSTPNNPENNEENKT